MAIGDGTDATAAGMAVVLGTALANTLDTLITATRDYLANGPMYWKPGVQACSIAQGGTGATTAAAARSALGITAANLGAAQDGIGTGLVFTSPGFNRLSYAAPGVTGGTELARQADVDARVSKSGDTMSGDLYIPGMSPAISGYTVMYQDGSGRLARGASSERYKKYISDQDPAALGNLFPQLKRYQMRTGDGTWKYGYTAEQLAASPDTEPFVVYATTLTENGVEPMLDGDGNPVPESIDFIAFLLTQNAQQAQQIAHLVTRVEALEAS